MMSDLQQPDGGIDPVIGVCQPEFTGVADTALATSDGYGVVMVSLSFRAYLA